MSESHINTRLQHGDAVVNCLPETVRYQFWEDPGDLHDRKILLPDPVVDILDSMILIPKWLDIQPGKFA